MNESPTWDDESREALKQTLREIIVGEVRLANSDQNDIMTTCREGYIEDECPEEEWDVFVKYASDELKNAINQHSSEKKAWPSQTDCDRLDLVEKDLREQGILLWQVSPCCDTCSGAELPDRIDEIESRYPGFRDSVRGYAFYIDQNMPEMLAESTQISIYMAYGWFSPDNVDVAPDVYEHNALEIANQICTSLRNHGFKPEWNGDFSKKIGVSLNWQRRTMMQ